MSEKLSSSPFMLAIEKAVIFIAFYTKKKKKEKDANIAFEVKLPEEFVQR